MKAEFTYKIFVFVYREPEPEPVLGRHHIGRISPCPVSSRLLLSTLPQMTMSLGAKNAFGGDGFCLCFGGAGFELRHSTT
jgi:hypothetical protein